MNIGELYVRLMADPSGVDKGVEQAEKRLGGLSSAAKAAGVAIAGAFAAKKVIDFGRESIKTFSEAEAIWNRLAGTLDVAGVAFEDVKGEITGAAAEMQRLTTVGDEDFAATLQTLIRTSGDYAASLQHVQTVADFAAGAQMDLNAAAVLVGKAMVGETSSLSRYGIVVEEGADAMAILQERFAGMAANEAKTLQGQTTQLSNAWGDFKEAIGGALVGAAEGEGILGRVTLAVQSMTAWVEKNGHQLQAMGQAFLAVGQIIMMSVSGWVQLISLITETVTAMVEGVKAKFAQLTAVFDRVKGGVESVTGAFRNMFDKVVGNSYVPDMVDGIAAQFARLESVMVRPAQDAAGQVNAAFAGIQGPGAGKGGIGGMLGGLLGAGGMLASLNPVSMITSMALGAASGVMRGVIGKAAGAIGGFFGIGGKDKPAASVPRAPAPAPRPGSSVSGGSYDVDAARRGVMGGSGAGLTVVINNPPASMDVVAVARQVKQAIAEDRRRGGVSSWDLAFEPAY